MKVLTLDGLITYDDSIKEYIDNNAPTIAEIMILQKAYPVGAIYMSVSPTSPVDLFGFGQWEQIKDTFLMCAGKSYSAGSTGGSSKHNHQYGFQYGAYCGQVLLEGDSRAGVLNYAANGSTSIPSQSTVGDYSAVVNGGTEVSSSSKTSTHYKSVGNVSTSSSMPPYLSVYVWKRIS